MSHAWNTGDALAYSELFTTDASYLDVRGGLSRGRAEIEAGHRWLFRKMAGSRMASGADAGLEIRFLTQDVAVVLGTGGGTTLPGRPLTADRTSAVSLVVVRADQRWRLAHFQNTRIAAPPAIP